MHFQQGPSPGTIKLRKSSFPALVTAQDAASGRIQAETLPRGRMSHGQASLVTLGYCGGGGKLLSAICAGAGAGDGHPSVAAAAPGPVTGG